MRTKIALVTVATWGLAASAHANPGPTLPMPLASSDTLRAVTLDAIAACAVNRDGAATPLGAHLRGTGGGSSLAGTRMNPAGVFGPNGQQQVAPQSRFLSAAECSQVAPNAGQGVQLGLDGVALFHDDTERSPCRTLRYAGRMPIRDLNRANDARDLNGDGDTTDPLESKLGYGLGLLGLDDGVALLSDNPATTNCNEAVEYCFTDWRDVLRIVYVGLTSHVDDSGPVASCRSTAPATSPTSARRCNSDVRHTLVSQWSNMFDTFRDDGAGGCSDDNCTEGLTHAWRRDDLSGTTDVFLSLIGAPSVGAAGAPVKTFCNGIENEDLDPIRRDCTTNSNASLDPASVCSAVAMRYRNLPFDSSTGSPTGAAIAAAGPQVTPPPAPGVSDLGLVLTISLPDTAVNEFVQSPPNSGNWVDTGHVLLDPSTGQPYNAQYDETFCSAAAIGSGRMALAEMPFSALPTTQRCPSGSLRSANKCPWPTQPGTLTNGKAGWFNCKTRRTNRLTGAAAPWTNYDARAYNRVPRHPQTGAMLLPDMTSGTSGIKDPRFTGGGDARIHMSFPKTALLDGSGNLAHPACRQPDATTQIGCLVQADICSVGFAGLEAEDGDVDAAELAIRGVNLPFNLRVPLDLNTDEVMSGDDAELDPRVTTIQRLTQPSDDACALGVSDFDVRYPLARLLWLNSSKGFGTAFPGALSRITNLVDSDPDFTQTEPPINGSAVPDGVPDLATRENDLVQCMTNRTFLDPILESHGFIPLPLAQPASARLRSCP